MTDHHPDGRTSRRMLIQGGALLLLAGCTSRSDQAVPPIMPGARPTAATPRAASPVDVPGYVVLPGEVEAACKAAAVLALESALTWRGGASSMEAAQRRLGALGVPAAGIATVGRLLGQGAWSSFRVTYPQYGGLVADLTSASVMITGEQLLPDGPVVSSRSIIADVRLVRQAGAWAVTEVLVPDVPAASPQPSASAQAVLDNPRIALPGPARADVQAGLVDDRVLDLLTSMSSTWTLGVHVFRSGHPVNVFATERESNHTRGRAVDIWALDDVPVIAHDRADWQKAMEAAAALGASEIGGPKDLDGVRGRRPYFSDRVHQDHLHVGFDAA